MLAQTVISTLTQGNPAVETLLPRMPLPPHLRDRGRR